MKTTKMFTILVLALGLMVWSAPMASGAQSLTVNGHDAKSITLEVGQSCTVEVVSDDSRSYTDYVGFDNGVVLGSFSHIRTMKAAGDRAGVTEYNEPAFYGYLIVAEGFIRLPIPGVHFIFKYEAQQVGETDLKLYIDNPPPLAGKPTDTVHITVIPAPMGTAFTYQGQLNDAGSPADGLYDFEFKLYRAPNGGIQEGNTIDINGLDVIDGQFVVELDFGSDPNIFNGYARWLQIGVRPGDSNDVHTMLSPRMELMPTPYAIYAQEAAYAQGATDLTLPYSGTVSSGAAAFSMTNTGTGYAGDFEQTGASNDNGGLNVTTAAGRFGAKILNQGGNSGYIELYGLKADVISTDKGVYGGHFTANSGGWKARGIFIEADVTQPTGSYSYSYGLELYSDCANGRAYGIYSDVGVGSGSTENLYGIYSYGKHLGTSGESYGMFSSVYGSDEGDSYGIYSIGRKNSTDTAGTAYGGYFIADNDRTGGESRGVCGKAEGSGGTNIGVFGIASNGTTNYAGYFDGDVGVRNGNLKIFSGGTLVLELGAGLDYAEGFDISESTKIDAGSVLIIDAENPGKLALSTKPYDSKVAGIVAGAKGIGSGVRLGTGEFDYDVALAGRVYCNVDTTHAGVEPGDLLTTSATPGYAMKSTDYARAQGAILGKAMESLEKGQKGQILVLVTLQ